MHRRLALLAPISCGDFEPHNAGALRPFKNVVAQFIGRLGLITQGNYKNLGVKLNRESKLNSLAFNRR
jgi:hypothetical protein